MPRKRLGKPLKEVEIKALLPPAEIVPDMEFDTYLPEKPLVPETSVFDDSAAMIEPEDDGLFGVEDVPETVLPVATPMVDTISEQAEIKQELTRLLNTEMKLEERVRLLAKLARSTDTKRAPVALRAIQEINALTGLSADKPADSTPMFALPEGTAVSVRIEKQGK